MKNTNKPQEKTRECFHPLAVKTDKWFYCQMCHLCATVKEKDGKLFITSWKEYK